MIIGNNNNFKSLSYKAKQWEDTVAQPAPNINDGILKDAIIAVPLKDLSHFWRSLKIPLITCKVTKYCFSCS